MKNVLTSLITFTTIASLAGCVSVPKERYARARINERYSEERKPRGKQVNIPCIPKDGLNLDGDRVVRTGLAKVCENGQ